MQEAQRDTEGAILSRRSSKFSAPGHRERAWVFVMYSPCLLKSVWVGFDGHVLKSGGFTFFSLAVRYCTGSDEWVITGHATMGFPISRSFFFQEGICVAILSCFPPTAAFWVCYDGWIWLLAPYMAAGGWSYLGTRSLCLLRLNRTLNTLASRMGNKICSCQLDGWLYGVEVCLGV